MHIYNEYIFFFYKWCIQCKLFKNCLSLFNLFIVRSFRVPNICSTVFYFNGCTTDNMPERDVTKWKTFTQTAFIIIWLITFARNQNLLLMTSMIMSVSPLFNLFYFTRVINLKAHKSTIVFKRTYRINSFQYLFNFLINQFIFYYLRDFFSNIKVVISNLLNEEWCANKKNCLLSFSQRSKSCLYIWMAMTFDDVISIFSWYLCVSRVLVTPPFSTCMWNSV